MNYLVNNENVPFIPIINTRPIRNKKFPIAIKEESNNKITPKIINKIPNIIKPVPIC